MRRKKLNTLIRQAIAGDAGALEQLCQQYAKTILFQVRLLVRNKDDAEDVAQRVAIAMIGDIQQLRSPYAFRSWLQRLIVNACNRQNAMTRREYERVEGLELAESIVDESPEARPEESAASRDMQRFVGGYLEKLPPAQAISLTLYYYEQLSYREVAETMGVSVGSVSNTISKAKQNLRKMMKANGEQDVLGITFTAPSLRGDVGRTVVNEVESSVPDGAVGRFMAVCKSHIAGLSVGVGAITATQPPLVKIWKGLAGAAASLILFGGIGIGAYLLDEKPSAPAPNPEIIQETPSAPVPAPESRVVYSVSGEQTQDDPTNPLSAQLHLLSGERLEGWTLTDVAGIELLSGTQDVGKPAPEADAALGGVAGTDGMAASEDVEGDFIDIASLGLLDGAYTLNWHLVNEQGAESRIYWDFVITSTP
ncbi:MAG: RNA polymerase sigma factor [Coriobacteriales bacterium]|nr:RNA polymerase sigma factor [Coriobacteriales bacterium]